MCTEMSWGKGCRSTLCPQEGAGRTRQNKITPLILCVDACVKKIFELGRKFPWPRPERCPLCGGVRIWGHGFVEAYFDGFDQALFLRRYRCAGCRAIFRLRPRGYWRRFQAPICTIRSALARRLKTGRWPPGLSRSRQGHWLRALCRQVLAYLGLGWAQRLLEGFDRLCEMGKIAASRSI